jgi:hypothetical protein
MRIMAELERCKEYQVGKTLHSAHELSLDIVIIRWCGSWYRQKSYVANSWSFYRNLCPQSA